MSRLRPSTSSACGVAVVVGVMTRAPSAPGKTRLVGALPAARAVSLRGALLNDTLLSVSQVRGIREAVVYTPTTAARELGRVVCRPLPMISQRGDTLGERMHGALVNLLALARRGAIVIGSDLPTLPPRYLQQAVATLASSRDAVVLGPALDGGYYLVGVNRPHRALFANLAWGSSSVLRRTLERAHRLNLPVSLLPEWYDVDSPADLRRALAERPTKTLGLAPHTRAWWAGTPAAVRAQLLSAAERAASPGQRGAGRRQSSVRRRRS